MWKKRNFKGVKTCPESPDQWQRHEQARPATSDPDSPLRAASMASYNRAQQVAIEVRASQGWAQLFP